MEQHCFKQCCFYKNLRNIRNTPSVPFREVHYNYFYGITFSCTTTKGSGLRRLIKDVILPLEMPKAKHVYHLYDFLYQSRGEFTVSEKYAKEILSLPMYAELSKKEIQFICRKIEEFYQ